MGMSRSKGDKEHVQKTGNSDTWAYIAFTFEVKSLMNTFILCQRLRRPACFAS